MDKNLNTAHWVVAVPSYQYDLHAGMAGNVLNTELKMCK